MKFSANLGFLWADKSLSDAIYAAKKAGFDAVECHWPYDTPASEILAALQDTGLPMLGLNTIRGKKGENGLSALQGREDDAKKAIDQAIAYAIDVDAQAIHVMAGFAEGDAARDIFMHNLKYARQSAPENITILIEPLNRHDAPRYFLQTLDQASDIIRDLALPNIKIMFDCYHVGRTQGDITTRLRQFYPIIGHIQFASVPNRGAPNMGEINYTYIFEVIESLGWQQPLGAEYKPNADTEDTLGWLDSFKSKSI